MPSTSWDARYAAMSSPLGAPSPLLLEEEHRLPRVGRALDVAGGRGRHALWLAERGLHATLVDASAVALELAQTEATRRGLSLRTELRDLEASPTLPLGPWDLVIWTNYLNRPLLRGVSEVMAPGGLLLLAHPTRRNLQRNPRPSARFLLEAGELPDVLVGMELLRHEEGWTEGGRHEAWVVARRSHTGDT